jgi:tetratricopeptide (TPR) repeat protein
MSFCSYPTYTSKENSTTSSANPSLSLKPSKVYSQYNIEYQCLAKEQEHGSSGQTIRRATGMGDILLYVSLAIVVLWTMRLARSKGRNPFLWGGASLGLMLLPSWPSPSLLSMAPMIALLFMKSPHTRRTISLESITCPKCQALHSTGHQYCVNCGWELEKPYVKDTTERVSSTMAASEKPEPVAISTEAPERVPETTLAPEPRLSVEESVADEEKPSQEMETEESQEPPKLVFRRPLTAASLTERGLALFGQGKFQEAVDQFTKAIALDPNYRLAWARRAEAYDRLGLNAKAAEDQHHLETLGDAG